MNINTEETDKICKAIAELLVPTISEKDGIKIVSSNQEFLEQNLKYLVSAIKLEIIHDLRGIM